jgi:hypothetical protein
MKHLALLTLVLCAIIPGAAMGSDPAEKCAGILRAESFGQMGRDQLDAHRQQVRRHTPEAVVEALCKSTTSLTYSGYRQNIERARQAYAEAGGRGFDPAELYFFLECGQEQVNLSPLSYHAFNLNRDEHGFIGESTLAIVWMSIAYLDIRDPGRDRSFMDAVKRILAYARKNDAQEEVEIYEDLLLQIDGFREDYEMSVEECRAVPGSTPLDSRERDFPDLSVPEL